MAHLIVMPKSDERRVAAKLAVLPEFLDAIQPHPYRGNENLWEGAAEVAEIFQDLFADELKNERSTTNLLHFRKRHRKQVETA